MKRRGQKTSRSRRGSVLVVALACLVILGVVQVLVVKSVVANRQVLREQAFRQQARWLAEAGIERAASRLKGDADYRGETWQLPAESLPALGTRPGENASVEIEIRPPPGDARARLVSVRAAYPRELPQRVLYEKEITFSPSRGTTP